MCETQVLTCEAQSDCSRRCDHRVALILSLLPSGDLRRLRRRLPERDNHAEPATRVTAPIITLENFRGGVNLQAERTKVVTEQSADGALALFLIARNWTR